jgi:acyl-CoA reductase-like NAD-dependent aldehyde dehydrogenase
MHPVRRLIGGVHRGAPGNAPSMTTLDSSSTQQSGTYPDFTTMPIAGRWRPGRSGKTGTDTDPWSGATIIEIPLASAADLDEAFTVAAEIQRDWSARPPAERAAVMRAAGVIMLAGGDLMMTGLAVALAAVLVTERGKNAVPPADLAVYNARLASMETPENGETRIGRAGLTGPRLRPLH